MVTATAVLYSRKNKEGKYPLAIGITKNRKSSFLFLGQVVDKDQWDNNARKVKRNHPNSARLNALIVKKLAAVNKTLLTAEIEDKDTSVQELHKAVVHNKPENSFFAEATKYFNNLREERKYNRYTSEKPRIERFRLFLKGKDIRFEEITISLLAQFKAFLKGNTQPLKELPSTT